MRVGGGGAGGGGGVGWGCGWGGWVGVGVGGWVGVGVGGKRKYVFWAWRLSCSSLKFVIFSYNQLLGPC